MSPVRLTSKQYAAIKGGTAKPKKKRKKDHPGYDGKHYERPVTTATACLKCEHCGFTANGKSKNINGAIAMREAHEHAREILNVHITENH